MASFPLSLTVHIKDDICADCTVRGEWTAFDVWDREWGVHEDIDASASSLSSFCDYVRINLDTLQPTCYGFSVDLFVNGSAEAEGGTSANDSTNVNYVHKSDINSQFKFKVRQSVAVDTDV